MAHDQSIGKYFQQGGGNVILRCLFHTPFELGNNVKWYVTRYVDTIVSQERFPVALARAIL